jgi:type IV pilus assembly protein PilC
MPSYAWKGKNRIGELQEGVIVAETRDTAAAMLKRNGIQVLAVKAQAATGSKGFGKVNAKDLAIFTRQPVCTLTAALCSTTLCLRC